MQIFSGITILIKFVDMEKIVSFGLFNRLAQFFLFYYHTVREIFKFKSVHIYAQSSFLFQEKTWKTLYMLIQFTEQKSLNFEFWVETKAKGNSKVFIPCIRSKKWATWLISTQGKLNCGQNLITYCSFYCSQFFTGTSWINGYLTSQKSFT